MSRIDIKTLLEIESVRPGRGCRPEILVLLGVTLTCISIITLPPLIAFASISLGVLTIIGADTDARTFRLPNYMTYGTIASGLIAAFVLHFQTRGSEMLVASLRGFGTASAFLALRWLYGFIRNKEGLGLGDVKLAMAIGVWLPIDLVPLCIGLASATALIAEPVLSFTKTRANRDTRVPFGAYLCPSLWLIFFVNALMT